MTTPKERAEVVGDRPDVQRWIKRFEKLAREMPPDVWVFVASGTPAVLARGEDGRDIDNGSGGVDQGAVIDTIAGGNWDGGDW